MKMFGSAFCLRGAMLLSVLISLIYLQNVSRTILFREQDGGNADDNTYFSWVIQAGVNVPAFASSSSNVTTTTSVPTTATLSDFNNNNNNNNKPTTTDTNQHQHHLQFVFVVGLEGTGHHLMGRIIQNSPAFYRLKRQIPNYRSEMKELHLALFDKNHGRGLWNHHRLPCNTSTTTTTTTNNINTTKEVEEEEERRLERVVEILKRIQKQHSDYMFLQAEAQPTATTTRTTTSPPPMVVRFPINTITVDKDDKNSFGQASFPNFGGGTYCGGRSQQYPRLDLWYRACSSTMANVDCRHVYLYRDPVSILYSTTIHRPFNANISQGIALYQKLSSDVLLSSSSQQQQQQSPPPSSSSSSLARHANHSLGCLGFYNHGDDADDWKRTVQELWQWRNTTKFEETIHRIYRPPSFSSTTTSSTTDASSGSWLQLEECDIILMEKWKDAHSRLLELCSSSAEKRM